MRVQDLNLDYVGAWVRVEPRRFWKRTWEGKLLGVWREDEKWFVNVYNSGQPNIVEVKPKDHVETSL